MKALTTIIFLCFSIYISAQNLEKCACAQKDKSKVRKYFENLKEQDDFIAECEQQITQNQIAEFGKVLPKIAGECEWISNGCPIKLVIPIFPELAKNLNIFGSVEVEIIADEKGLVIYAKAIRGKPMFYSDAEVAACRSRFYPKTICGKVVKQKRIIRYNFIQ